MDARPQHATTAGSMTPPGDGLRPAFLSPRAWAWFVGTIVVSLAVDLLTKYAAFRHVAGVPVAVRREDVVLATPRLFDLIPAHPPVKVIPGLLDFTLVLNPGAVFGMGAGKRWFFITFTGLAIAAGTLAFARLTSSRDRLMHVALGLILGGGLGNLYDRLIYACVRDFLHPLPGVMLPFGWSWPWGGREVWPYVSNVADAFLLVGVGVLMWKTLRGHEGPAQPRPSSAR